MKKPTFYQITDLHLYADEAIGSYGKAYDLKAQMDQKVFRGSMVHGEEKCGWTKLISVEVWSMKRKRAGGPNSFQQEYGPWGEKERVDQIVIGGGMVQEEKKRRWTK